MSEQVSVEITSVGPVAVVSFTDASLCDIEQIDAASKQIKEFINKNHPNRLVFDFEGVRFFSSQVLGVLLETRATLEPYDGEVVISAISPQLHRVFKITNLDQIFRFFPDKQSAVKAVTTV